MMRAGLLAVAAVLAFVGVAIAQVAVPPLTGRVVDKTGTLTTEQLGTLEQRLREFEARKGSQVAVLIVPSTAPETIEQFSLRVVEQWKLGRKKVDDGALLIVAKNDRALRIEVGYGLEGALTDVTSKRIIDEIIVPRFRAGDFYGGISDGVGRIIAVIDGEPLPPPAGPAGNSLDQFGDSAPFAIIIAVALAQMLRSVFGGFVTSLLAGIGVAGVLWFVTGVWLLSLLAGGFVFVVTLAGVTFGSSGGGGGFSSSGSSSSGGGFSGGGGSFGGGGASGRW